MQLVGHDPPFSNGQLQVCEGDCDNDSECGDGLTCFRREAGSPIPFCSGTASNADTDYCVRIEAGLPRLAHVTRFFVLTHRSHSFKQQGVRLHCWDVLAMLDNALNYVRKEHMSGKALIDLCYSCAFGVVVGLAARAAVKLWTGLLR